MKLSIENYVTLQNMMRWNEQTTEMCWEEMLQLNF